MAPTVTVGVLVIILAVLGWLFCVVRKKRQTEGTYMPSAEEQSGTRSVAALDALKLPKEERLIWKRMPSDQRQSYRDTSWTHDDNRCKTVASLSWSMKEKPLVFRRRQRAKCEALDMINIYENTFSHISAYSTRNFKHHKNDALNGFKSVCLPVHPQPWKSWKAPSSLYRLPGACH